MSTVLSAREARVVHVHSLLSVTSSIARAHTTHVAISTVSTLSIHVLAGVGHRSGTVRVGCAVLLLRLEGGTNAVIAQLVLRVESCWGTCSIGVGVRPTGWRDAYHRPFPTLNHAGWPGPSHAAPAASARFLVAQRQSRLSKLGSIPSLFIIRPLPHVTNDKSGKDGYTYHAGENAHYDSDNLTSALGSNCFGGGTADSR